jgi:hypothetical protein
MKYKVEYDINSSVCVVRVSGVYQRPQDSQELLRIAGAFAAEHGCSRFLFDMREASIVGGTMDAYNTVVDHEKYGVSKLFWIAVVYQAISENDKFMENGGVNRGAAAYQVFDDIDAAHDWITK